MNTDMITRTVCAQKPVMCIFSFAFDAPIQSHLNVRQDTTEQLRVYGFAQKATCLRI